MQVFYAYASVLEEERLEFIGASMNMEAASALCLVAPYAENRHFAILEMPSLSIYVDNKGGWKKVPNEERRAFISELLNMTDDAQPEDPPAGTNTFGATPPI